MTPIDNEIGVPVCPVVIPHLSCDCPVVAPRLLRDYPVTVRGCPVTAPWSSRGYPAYTYMCTD
eukprot:2363240-Pyramimonas_sp.AAC.1